MFRDEIVNLSNILEKLDTREELTYYILCSHNKYSFLLPRLHVLEGSYYYLLREQYCRNVYLVLKCLEYINVKPLAEYSMHLCIEKL